MVIIDVNDNVAFQSLNMILLPYMSCVQKILPTWTKRDSLAMPSNIDPSPLMFSQCSAISLSLENVSISAWEKNIYRLLLDN